MFGKDEELRIAIEEIAAIATRITGVQFSTKNYSMVESRLFRRMKDLGVPNIPKYRDYLKSNLAKESDFLISLMTTHHTFFFRESSHFDFLTKSVLPKIVERLNRAGKTEINLWCAACSRGQEAYSLAMWIKPWLESNAPRIKLKIYATDIDRESVDVGKNGVYQRSELNQVPMQLLRGNWAKGTGEIEEYVKAKDNLKAMIEFGVFNLFDRFPTKKFDVIFCRNVFIYFNQEQIKFLVGNFLKVLEEDGSLFVGISESLTGLGMPLANLGPSVYGHKAKAVAQPLAPALKVGTPVVAPGLSLETPQKIRVLAVDDSPTILSLLKKILSTQEGFEVVGTAKSGVEAQQAMAKGGIDLVTLDIHMPEMDGIEYLKKNYRSGHPPVVMISSVSRENADLALTALKLGASDYIEKPSLGDLQERKDEILLKLRCAYESKNRSTEMQFDSEGAKKFTIEHPEKFARIVFFPLSEKARVLQMLKSLPAQSPATYLMVEGSESALEAISQDMGRDLGLKIKFNERLNKGELGLIDFKNSWPFISQEKASFLCFGRLSQRSFAKIHSLKNVQILLDDHGKRAPSFFQGEYCHFLPQTSFLYQSQEFFSRKEKKAA